MCVCVCVCVCVSLSLSLSSLFFLVLRLTNHEFLFPPFSRMLNWSFFIFIIHRLMPGTKQVISLSFFLGKSSSNRLLFIDFSRCQTTNKIVARFLSFSDGILIFSYELASERQIILCTTDTSVCYRVSRPTDLSDFSSDLTFPLLRITWAY